MVVTWSVTREGGVIHADLRHYREIGGPADWEVLLAMLGSELGADPSPSQVIVHVGTDPIPEVREARVRSLVETIESEGVKVRVAYSP